MKKKKNITKISNNDLKNICKYCKYCGVNNNSIHYCNKIKMYSPYYIVEYCIYFEKK